MPLLGRDREFAFIREQIARRIDDDGRLRPIGGGGGGSQVHIAVVAPRHGGLSCFLDSLESELRDVKGAEPFLLQLESADRIDADMASLITRIADAGGRKPPVESDCDALFEACHALHESTGRVPIVLLDASHALDGLVRSVGPTGRVAHSPLLQRLRVLGTYMEDREPTLVLIAGWYDDFPQVSADSRFQAQDVVQRYSPVVPLWPDFGVDDPWPLYAQILEQQGFSIGGSYAGFCRAIDPVPVGRVIQKAREANVQSIDGQFLLDVLAQRAPWAADVAKIERGTLAQLCLEDLPISRVTELKIPKQWIEPKDAQSLVASPVLYDYIGLRPPSARIALERRVRLRFDEGDHQLSREILEALSREQESTLASSPDGTYARVEMRLELSGAPPLESTISVAAYCTLADELSNSLVDSLCEDLTQADQPVNRANCYVLVLHRSRIHSSQLTQSLGARLNSGEQVSVRSLPAKGQLRNTRVPAAFASIEMSAAQVVELLANGDPSPLRECMQSELLAQLRAMYRHYPLLQPDDFEGDALFSLIQDSFVSRPLPTQREETRRFDRLADIGVLERDESGVVWRPRSDKLLARLQAANATSKDALLNALTETYSIRPTDRDALLKALANAYSAFMTVKPAGVSVHDSAPVVAQRAATLNHALAGRLDEIRDIDPARCRELEDEFPVGVADPDAQELARRLRRASQEFEQLNVALAGARDEAKAWIYELPREVWPGVPDLEQESAASIAGLTEAMETGTLARLRELNEAAGALKRRIEQAKRRRAEVEQERRAQTEQSAVLRKRFEGLRKRALQSNAQSHLVESIDNLLTDLQGLVETSGVSLSKEEVLQSEAAKRLAELTIEIQRLEHRLKAPAPTAVSLPPKRSVTWNPVVSTAPPAGVPPATPTDDGGDASSGEPATPRSDGTHPPVQGSPPPEPKSRDIASKPAAPAVAMAPIPSGPSRPEPTSPIDPIVPAAPPPLDALKLVEYEFSSSESDLERLAHYVASDPKIVRVEVRS
jgi:hypothetical protein